MLCSNSKQTHTYLYGLNNFYGLSRCIHTVGPCGYTCTVQKHIRSGPYINKVLNILAENCEKNDIFLNNCYKESSDTFYSIKTFEGLFRRIISSFESFFAISYIFFRYWQEIIQNTSYFKGNDSYKESLDNFDS